METVGDDEKRGNRKEFDTKKAVQVRDTSVNSRRTELLTLSVCEGGPQTKWQRIRSGHYLLFGFR